jgi:TP53 regulating kinase-like protein
VKLRDVLEQREQVIDLGREMGQKIAKLHAANIIHGDLTTSNMILHETLKEVHFIDFGLSFFSEKVEDKAVDLFLLDRAIETTHIDKYPDLFDAVLEGYCEEYDVADDVLKRFEEVQLRGRNKRKEN